MVKPSGADFVAGKDFAAADAANRAAVPPVDDFEKQILGGDIGLSNTTMESFTQDEKQNCFTCHQTIDAPLADSSDVVPAKRLNVSHVLVNAFGNRKQVQQVIDQLKKIQQ